MARVAIVQPYVPQYRVALFERLDRRLRDSGHQLTVFAGTPLGANTERRDATNVLSFQHVTRTRSVRIGALRPSWKSVPVEAISANLTICELGTTVLENYRLARRARRFATWGHGFAVAHAASRIDSLAERYLLRRSVHFFAYTERGRATAESAGLESNQVTVLNNTIDTESLELAVQQIASADVDRFRTSADLRSRDVVAFIGGLDESKRIDLLLEVGDRLAHRRPDFRLLVAGDGAKRPLVEALARSRTWLRYVGRADERLKALIGDSARLLLNPGRVGLVAIDSFVLRLPIVTTDWMHHAPEFDYLVNGENAAIVRNDPNALVDGIIHLLDDDDQLQHLRCGCERAASRYSLQELVDRFAAGIESALATPARGA